MKMVRKTILTSSSIELHSRGFFSRDFIRDMLHNLWCREAPRSVLSTSSYRRDSQGLEFWAKRSLSARLVPFLETWHEVLKVTKTSICRLHVRKSFKELNSSGHSWCGAHSCPLLVTESQGSLKGYAGKEIIIIIIIFFLIIIIRVHNNNNNNNNNNSNNNNNFI